MVNDAWRNRLNDAVQAAKARGKSARAISLAAGRGPGYVHSLLKEGKDPTINNLADVCQQLSVSLSYILYGVELDAETEAIIRLLEENPRRRAAILQLLEEEARA